MRPANFVEYTVLSLATLLLGCAELKEEAEDGINDSFLDEGKADTGGIQEGTADALAVLRLANESSLATLTADVTLSPDAAHNIVAHRRGDDEKDGTEDDELFDSLAELDAIPYVGPIAFDKLRIYASNHPPPNLSIWSETWAMAPLATQSELLSHFAPGEGRVTVGDGTFVMRYRSCNALTGCGAWYAVNGVYFWAEDSPFYIKATLPSTPFFLVATASAAGVGCESKSVFDVYYYSGSISCGSGEGVVLSNVESPSALRLQTSTVVIPVATYRDYVYGRSALYTTGSEGGNYLEFQYALHAKLSPTASTPAFDR